MSGRPGFQMQPGNGSAPQQRPAAGGFDGPSSTGRPNPFGVAPLGYDPAKPAVAKEKVISNTRMDLPAAAYAALEYKDKIKFEFPTALPDRPGYNASGKDIQVRVNQYKVTQWPQQDIYQYDIIIGDGTDKRGKVMAVWKSTQVQNAINSGVNNQGPFIWDGNRIAWCKFRCPAMTLAVDLDKEPSKKVRKPRKDGRGPDICRVQIRETAVIRMAVIGAYLAKQIPFDASLLNAINLLDHIMRQQPSEKYTMIKRSFFAAGGGSSSLLDDTVMALKGVYSSIRLCSPISSTSAAPSTGLAINVDVANGTFWIPQDLHQCARNYLKQRNPRKDWRTMYNLLKPVENPKHGGLTMSEDFKALRKLTKLRFKVKHRQKGDDSKIYTIKGFSWGADADCKEMGRNAKTTKFMYKDPTGKESLTSVFDYFKKLYGMNLEHWQLPLVITERAGSFPMEVCQLEPNQRYMYKMSPDQTASMIKFAVTRPGDRTKSIEHGIKMLGWDNDRYLKHFGIKVDPQMTVTKAKLLPSPDIQFGGPVGAASKLNAGVTGKWDLRGKKLLLPNVAPLVSWGFLIIEGCVDEPVCRNFINAFVQSYTGHGGKISNKNPVVHFQQKGQDIPDALTACRQATGNAAQAAPQILFIVLPGRDSHMYERVKRNMDVRYAMVSQCVNVAHVRKASPQYCSNVCMKVNAKLGGTTSKVIVPAGREFFSGKTMILGADISHPSPGSQQGSVAALSMSMDQYASRYAAAVETNGHRVEMITKNNCRTMLLPMWSEWCNIHKGPPVHIYYFRDGVSEGQFTHVLDQEVTDLRGALEENYKNDAGKLAAIKAIKWTVIVCTKRHHIRIFPKSGDNVAGDRNGNPNPGVLLEHDVTHPFEYDFYLNSHSAIQGTARPVHYQVILDEINPGPTKLQTMIYHHSYQYMRSTTPVSLYPAVYYAHLAAARGRCHEVTPDANTPRGGQKHEEAMHDATVARENAKMSKNPNTPATVASTEKSSVIEVYPLLKMGGADNPGPARVMITAMWYI